MHGQKGHTIGSAINMPKGKEIFGVMAFLFTEDWKLSMASETFHFQEIQNTEMFTYVTRAMVAALCGSGIECQNAYQGHAQSSEMTFPTATGQYAFFPAQDFTSTQLVDCLRFIFKGLFLINIISFILQAFQYAQKSLPSSGAVPLLSNGVVCETWREIMVTKTAITVTTETNMNSF